MQSHTEPTVVRAGLGSRLASLPRKQGWERRESSSESMGHIPAYHHQLLLRSLPAEALPYIYGKQGATAVEDGGE